MVRELSLQRELDSRALALLRDKRDRRDALQALEGSSSRQVVQQLLAALESFAYDQKPLRAATHTLKTCRHPDAVKLMVAFVRSGMKALPTDLSQYPRRYHIEAVLLALAERRSPAIARLAMELLDEFGATAAEVLVHSANREQLMKLGRCLRGNDGNLFAAAVECVFRTSKDPFRELSPLFTAGARTTRLGEWRIREVLDNLLKHRSRISQDWHGFLLSLLEKDPALPLGPWFAARQDRLATPALVRAAAATNEDIRYPAIEALGRLRAPEALDAIFDCLWMNDLRWTVIANAARRIPGAAEKLRARLAKVKRPKSATHQRARELLDLLEA